MFDKKRALICSVILYAVAAVFIVLAVIFKDFPVLDVVAICCLIGAVVMTVVYAVKKKKEKSGAVTAVKESTAPIKKRTADEIFSDGSVDSYSKFVEWWAECGENEIKSNSLLLGAHRIMTAYNEVCNGGFGQFFDCAEEWDTERTLKLFKRLLPKDFYDLFARAWQAHKNGEDCEKFNADFDYGKMENEILPNLAEMVENNYKSKTELTEYDLIEGVTPYFKARGYKKKGKRWTKDTGEFALSFYIQGSQYDQDSYYVRPGVFVNGVAQGGLDYYGHFFYSEVKPHSVEQVIARYEKFVKEWTDKPLIKKRLDLFNVWESRNPLEKRRQMTGKDPYKDDPIPEGCDVFFTVNEVLKKHISENF